MSVKLGITITWANRLSAHLIVQDEQFTGLPHNFKTGHLALYYTWNWLYELKRNTQVRCIIVTPHLFIPGVIDYFLDIITQLHPLSGALHTCMSHWRTEVKCPLEPSLTLAFNIHSKSVKCVATSKQWIPSFFKDYGCKLSDVVLLLCKWETWRWIVT